GAVLSADHVYPHAYLHCGHKGLFFDRLDGGVGVGGSGVNLEPPRLIPFAHYVYQIRNRAYSPGLGRFFQRDPNATAMTLLAATAHHGRGGTAISIAFDMESMYGDGMNLYEYLGSNPWRANCSTCYCSQTVLTYLAIRLCPFPKFMSLVLSLYGRFTIGEMAILIVFSNRRQRREYSS
ncbi:MAG: hypothetical protein H7Y88_12040, partial [Phycisphaerales bacterium]|nr:hypothetical protein [Phycisphaerales bacterium]